MRKTSTTAKRAIAICLSAAMAVSGASVASSAKTASKPTLDKKVTVAVGAKTKLSIKANSFTIKSVKAKSSSKKVLVKASKKAVTITGKKTGSAKITTTIKAKKGNKKVKTFTYTTKVTVKKAADKPTPSPEVAVEVSTQEELNKALKNKKLTKLIIGNDAVSMDIPEGKYDKVMLIIDAPKATINNYGEFKEIEVRAIAANTLNQFAPIRTLRSMCTDTFHLVNDCAGKLGSLIFGAASDTCKNIIDFLKGTLGKLDIQAKTNVELKAQGDSKIDQINVDAPANVAIAASEKSEVSAVNVTAQGADVGVSARGDSTIKEVNVKESAGTEKGTAEGDQTKVEVKAEGNAKVDAVNTAAENTPVAVVSNGNSTVNNVVVEGSASATVSGDSSNTTNIDISGASKDANVVVNTSTVVIQTNENTDVKDVINNQSGKDIPTVTKNADGTTQTGTKPADGSAGVTPSGLGGSSGPSAPRYCDITLNFENVDGTITDEEAARTGFVKVQGRNIYRKSVQAGTPVGDIPTITNGSYALDYLANDNTGNPLTSDFVPYADNTFHPLWFGDITVKYDVNGGNGSIPALTISAANVKNYGSVIPNIEPTYTAEEGRYFANWALDKQNSEDFEGDNTSLRRLISAAIRSGQNNYDRGVFTGNITLYAIYTFEGANKVQAALNALTFNDIKGTNTSADNVTANLSLKSTLSVGGKEYTIVWESSNTKVVSDAGVVTKGAHDEYVEMYPHCSTVYRNSDEHIGFTVPKDPNLLEIVLCLNGGRISGNDDCGYTNHFYNDDNQEVRTKTIDRTNQTTLGTLPTVAWDGHIFEKWVIVDANGDYVSDASSVTSSTGLSANVEDITVSAVWSRAWPTDPSLTVTRSGNKVSVTVNNIPANSSADCDFFIADSESTNTSDDIKALQTAIQNETEGSQINLPDGYELWNDDEDTIRSYEYDLASGERDPSGYAGKKICVLIWGKEYEDKLLYEDIPAASNP